MAQQTERVALTSGSYVSRSLIASAQRQVNLYAEHNPQGSPSPVTLYQTPGLTKLAIGPLNCWRGLYTASNGVLYGVLGINAYLITSNWALVLLGTLAAPLTTPVVMSDNGAFVFIVDGSPNGYTVSLVTNVMTQLGIADNFLGATHVAYLDTFLIFNQPATKNFYCSLSNSVSFDPTFIAGKTGYSDNIACLCAMHRELWLLGQVKTSEVWYNAGGANFPFAIVPGVFIEHAAIVYSLAQHDLMTFWLGVDNAGARTVFMGQNYAARRISTPAIAAMLHSKPIADAIGMVYKIEDHVFYVLQLPTANMTLVYDASEDSWHEWTYTDNNGLEQRHRANCMAFAYDTNVCGDFANGNLYSLDLANFTDDGQPIVRRRTFPHLALTGNLTTFARFRADMECGTALTADTSVSLRWSDDRGRTYGNPVTQSLGAQGSYLARPQWNQLGMAMDRIFELFWSAQLETALNGAWVEREEADH